MTAITFPPSPSVGQEYVALNTVTYVWMGTYWSSKEAIISNRAKYYVEGGDSAWNYTTPIDNTLDGGTA
jgi:hypothetical protein